MSKIRISDNAVATLMVVAKELLDARDDSESQEAIRAFLTACRSDGVIVDGAGELAAVDPLSPIVDLVKEIACSEEWARRDVDAGTLRRRLSVLRRQARAALKKLN